jgi:hypothetical protein
LVELINVALNDVCAVPPDKPEIPVTEAGAFHEYVVFDGTIVAEVGEPFTGVKLNTPPLQTEPVWFVITGDGLTVIVILKAFPLQDPVVVVGVTL